MMSRFLKSMESVVIKDTEKGGEDLMLRQRANGWNQKTPLFHSAISELLMLDHSGNPTPIVICL